MAAARSIVIEDATPGILSARAAGLRVIAVQAGNFVGYDLSPADVVVDTLDEVTDELCARLLALTTGEFDTRGKIGSVVRSPSTRSHAL